MADLARCPARGESATASVCVRRATRGDLPAIVALLVDDEMGRSREPARLDPLPREYAAAFEAIDASPAAFLGVAELAGAVVGTFMITVIPGLSSLGQRKALVEAVRTASAVRGRGVGSAMMAWAIELARRQGCGVVQLTTHKDRLDAHRFYERLGFHATHIGMKLTLR